METFTITYRIRLSKRVVETFTFVLDAHTGDLKTEPLPAPPRWTELDYQQCPHCPLKKEQHPHCPLALQLCNIIDRLHDTTSFDEVDMEVITPERTITQHVELQRVIGSMVGLVSPTCGCPKTAYMKPMARFHLPLSTEEETLFRVSGMYLLAQHLLGNKVDLAGLHDIYEELHVVNKYIASRLKHATESDSSKNAIALLDMYSNLVPMMIEEQLPELRQLFSAYEINTATIPLSTLSLQPLSLEPMVEVTPPPVKARTADDLALEELMQDVPVSEMEILLGATTLAIEPVKVEPVNTGPVNIELVNVEPMNVEPINIEPVAPQATVTEERKSFGRAVFKLPDD